MLEQSTDYKGSPSRPWIRVTLVADDGDVAEFELLADTGNPCAIIVDLEVMREFNSGVTEGMHANFGELEG